MKELTGKAKEAFERWLEDNLLMDLFCIKEYTEDGINYKEVDIHHLPESMQWGLLVGFFDSVGCEIEIRKTALNWMFYVFPYDDLPRNEVKKLYESRPEARRAAIEKATEIFNER